MHWSIQQANALNAVAIWMQDPSRKVFVLHGLAGTGKTELAKHFAEGFSDVRFATYTGKAALVLQRRGCPRAQTVHSLFFSPAGQGPEWERYKELKESLLTAGSVDRKKIEKEMFALRKNLNRPRFSFDHETEARHADLVILDEASMLNEYMSKDIINACKKILFLGDPAQLPPIRGEGYFMTIEPDIMLSEIHRQALESPILRMAMLAREGKRIPYGDYGKAKHLPKHNFNLQELATYDQIIAGFNKTRRSINMRMRKHLGRDGNYPVAGDRLICLRNNRDKGLLNGLQGIATTDSKEIGDLLVISVDMDGEESLDDLNVWADAFDMYHRDVHPRTFFERIQAEEMDWSYCITAHKSQGSEFQKVVVCDDGFAMNQPDTRRRWAYTAITRAKEELLILS